MAKTLPPTRRRLEKARRDGDVAKSRDLTGIVIVFGCLALLYLRAPRYGALGQFLRQIFEQSGDFHTNHVLVSAKEAVGLALRLCLEPLGAAMVAAVVVEALQVGLKWTPATLTFKPARLGFSAGFRRILGLRETEGGGLVPLGLVFDSAKMTAYLLAVLGAFTWAAVHYAPALLTWRFLDAAEVLDAAASVLLPVASIAAAVLASVAVADLASAQRARLKRLQMDAEEMKREFRETDGDPHARSFRKQLHQELLAYGAVQGVRRAKVLVVADRHRANRAGS